ncbi:hypothetical protein ACQP2U_23000 [Nocardia sp. CA-084685]|uniref:hypothetical protein n=1 Tax=Nocardia sp. CA-084685 TaxID=3239970 RepID=UPI003D9512F1
MPRNSRSPSSAPATGPTSATSQNWVPSTTPPTPATVVGSTTYHELGYVGLEWQRSLSSASLRGVGADAIYLATRLP